MVMKSLFTFALLGVLAWYSSSWLGGTYHAAEVGRILAEEAVQGKVEVQRVTQSIVDTFDYFRALHIYLGKNTKQFLQLVSYFVEDKTTPLRGVRFSGGQVFGSLGAIGEKAFNLFADENGQGYVHISDGGTDWWFDAAPLPEGIVFSQETSGLKDASYTFEIVLQDRQRTITASWAIPATKLDMSSQEIIFRVFPWFVYLLLALILISANLAQRASDSEKRAFHDPLTGAGNKAWLARWKRNAAEGEAVVLMDCNDFKAINDNFGHGEGDKALKILAQTVLRNLRQDDIFFRTGGDEFVIVLSSIFEKDTAKKVARRIRRQIAQETKDKLQSGSLSVSLGISLIKGSGEVSANKAIQEADKRMYRYKNFFCKYLKRKEELGSPLGDAK